MRPSRSLFIAAVATALFLVASPAISAQSAPQIPSQWNEPVRLLAEKIAAAVGSPIQLDVEWANMSSLLLPEASGIYESVVVVLRARRFVIVQGELPSPPGRRARITFSEGADGYVWVAEIWPPQDSNQKLAGPEDRQVVLVAAPKVEGMRAHDLSLVFSRKVVWAQPEKFLDFAAGKAPNGSQLLLVLEPGRLAFYYPSGTTWQLNHAISVYSAKPWPRDLRGGHIDAATGHVQIDEGFCRGDFAHVEDFRCDQGANPTKEEILENLPSHSGNSVAPGAPGPVLKMACAGMDALAVASGGGDWTQPDYLQAFQASAREWSPVGEPFGLSGPVLQLSLAADRTSVRVVSRNLKTGMYEASIVSISCGN